MRLSGSSNRARELKSILRTRQCREERGMLPNILAVDFALTGDVVGAVADLNGLN